MKSVLERIIWMVLQYTELSILMLCDWIEDWIKEKWEENNHLKTSNYIIINSSISGLSSK